MRVSLFLPANAPGPQSTLRNPACSAGSQCQVSLWLNDQSASCVSLTVDIETDNKSTVAHRPHDSGREGETTVGIVEEQTAEQVYIEGISQFAPDFQVVRQFLQETVNLLLNMNVLWRVAAQKPATCAGYAMIPLVGDHITFSPRLSWGMAQQSGDLLRVQSIAKNAK